MRVLLIHPWCSSNLRRRTWSAEPLGLLYLATTLRREMPAVVVSVLDAHFEGADHCLPSACGWRSGLSDAELDHRLLESQADIVGVSMSYTPGVEDALEVCRSVRRSLPRALVVIGGAHATLDHERLAALPEVDIVCRGEGERTLVEIVDRWRSRVSVRGCAGTTYRAAWSVSGMAGVHVNDPRAPIDDLDWLPAPDRSFLPYWRYLDRETYWCTMNRPVGSISTSRGCPFRCSFCSTVTVWGNRWRGRSARSVVNECTLLRDRWGVREIAFQDDQLLGSKDRMMEFCTLARRELPGMTFIAPNGTSPALYSPELLRAMRLAGFYRLCMSVDVGNEGARKWAKKPIQLGKIRGLVREANRLGYWTYGTFLVGFPDETEEMIEETIRYAWGLRLDFLRFYIAQPHFGTELRAQMAQAGLLRHALQATDNLDAQYDTNQVKATRLEALRSKGECGYLRAHMKHFANPLYVAGEFLPKVWGQAGLRYGWRVARRMAEVMLSSPQ